MSVSPTSPEPLGLHSRGPVVSRTHRVVRERARNLQARRSRNRSLLAPVLVASALIIILISAFWIMFDEYEVLADSAVDGKFHLPILLIWFLPVTGALLIAVVMKRFKVTTDDLPLAQEHR